MTSCKARLLIFFFFLFFLDRRKMCLIKLNHTWKGNDVLITCMGMGLSIALRKKEAIIVSLCCL